MKFKCGVCQTEHDEKNVFDIYMGMGITQYVCNECESKPFNVVMAKLDECESPAYVGNIPLEDIHSSARRVKT